MTIVKGIDVKLPIPRDVKINLHHTYYEYIDPANPVLIDLTEMYGKDKNIPSEKELLKMVRKGEYTDACGARSIQKQFEIFHKKNPQVYDMLVDMARQVKGLGKDKLSIKLLYERVRWELLFETKSEDEFKLNNSFTSRYARLIMEQEEDLKDFFDLRQINTK